MLMRLKVRGIEGFWLLAFGSCRMLTFRLSDLKKLLHKVPRRRHKAPQRLASATNQQINASTDQPLNPSTNQP